MKFLYTDGKSKSFSGTTLRMWLAYALFYVTAIVMIVIELVSPGYLTERAITLLDVTLVAAGGGGALYLGKRVVERGPRAQGGMLSDRENTTPRVGGAP